MKRPYQVRLTAFCQVCFGLPLALWAACGGSGEPAEVDAGGTPQELVVATWNLGMFPHSPGAAAAIGDTFDALTIDVLAVEEVEDPAALDELAAAHGAMVALDPPAIMGTGPLLGVMWRPSAVDVTDSGVRFVGDPSFPRPVVVATVSRPGGGAVFELVIVHLKAGTAAADEQERLDAVAKVADLVSSEFAGQTVVVIGDFNEAASDPRSLQVFAPFLDSTTSGTDLITWPLAVNGAVTFLPAGIMLDHIAVTAPFAGTGLTPTIPPLDQQMTDYATTVSDHLPVVVHLPLQ